MKIGTIRDGTAPGYWRLPFVFGPVDNFGRSGPKKQLCVMSRVRNLQSIPAQTEQLLDVTAELGFS